jgi:hypothetical protein
LVRYPEWTNNFMYRTFQFYGVASLELNAPALAVVSLYENLPAVSLNIHDRLNRSSVVMVVISRIVASFTTRLSSTKLKYSVAEPEPESESELPKPSFCREQNRNRDLSLGSGSRYKRSQIRVWYISFKRNQSRRTIKEFQFKVKPFPFSFNRNMIVSQFNFKVFLKLCKKPEPNEGK